MAQFYRGTSGNVIGAPARILIAPSTSPVPTQLSEVVNMSTYAPNSTYGFTDLGLTRSPVTMDISASSQTWRSEQFGIFRTLPTDWRGSVKAEFLEVTQANKQAIMLASVATDSATREHRTNFAALINFPIVRLALMYIDHLGLVHATVYPNAQWDGAAITETLGRGASLYLPMTWTTYPDDTVIDTVTGLATIRFDFDQY
jgi:hypothetical protein